MFRITKKAMALVAVCALVFAACVVLTSCSNPADNGGSSGGSGASSTMTEAEAIAAINALAPGSTLTIKLGRNVTWISSNLKNALKGEDKKVALDLSESGVTSIDGFAFSGCTSLTSIVIPSSVTSIDWYAFNGCTSLTSIEIPNSVTSIDLYAFYGCTSLTSIEIPSSVTSIDLYAFYGCKSLTSIEIPSSVTSIDGFAFSGCKSLNTIKYTGTKDDWNTKIIFSVSSWRDDVPAKGVTCSDGKTYKFDGSKLGDEITE